MLAVGLGGDHDADLRPVRLELLPDRVHLRHRAVRLTAAARHAAGSPMSVRSCMPVEADQVGRPVGAVARLGQVGARRRTRSARGRPRPPAGRPRGRCRRGTPSTPASLVGLLDAGDLGALLGRVGIARARPARPMTHAWPRHRQRRAVAASRRRSGAARPAGRPRSRGTSACVSGSPQRALNSSTLGPSVGQHQPGVQAAAERRCRGGPARRSPGGARCATTSSTSSAGRRPAPASSSPCRRCWGRGRRRAARLWSRAGASGSTRSPSHSASIDTSAPSSRSSISTRAPAPPKRRSIRQARDGVARPRPPSSTRTRPCRRPGRRP